MNSTHKDSVSSKASSCSVVICTRNRPKQLDCCVRAVLRQRYSLFNVLIIDNASEDSQSFEVAARHGVRCIREPKVGLSNARNLGARESTADIVAYIDDDAIPEDGWIEGLCAEFSDSRVMGVLGRFLPSTLNTEGAHLWLDMGILDGGAERRVIDRNTSSWFESVLGGLGCGANMAIRRKALATCRFDPRLGRGSILYGGEEGDTFLALIEYGYRIVYTPAAIVRHPCPDTLPDLRKWHLATLAGSIGYLAYLFAHEPKHRLRILRHICSRLPRRGRRCFQHAPDEAKRIASLWQEALAGLKGLTLFARTLLSARDQETSLCISLTDRSESVATKRTTQHWGDLNDRTSKDGHMLH